MDHLETPFATVEEAVDELLEMLKPEIYLDDGIFYRRFIDPHEQGRYGTLFPRKDCQVANGPHWSCPRDHCPHKNPRPSDEPSTWDELKIYLRTNPIYLDGCTRHWSKIRILNLTKDEIQKYKDRIIPGTGTISYDYADETEWDMIRDPYNCS
jgi:hypothetical protein